MGRLSDKNYFPNENVFPCEMAFFENKPILKKSSQNYTNVEIFHIELILEKWFFVFFSILFDVAAQNLLQT